MILAAASESAASGDAWSASGALSATVSAANGTIDQRNQAGGWWSTSKFHSQGTISMNSMDFEKYGLWTEGFSRSIDNLVSSGWVTLAPYDHDINF